jgi:hypothetical protein
MEHESFEDEAFSDWLKYNKRDLMHEFCIDNKINFEEFEEDTDFFDWCREVFKSENG